MSRTHFYSGVWAALQWDRLQSLPKHGALSTTILFMISLGLEVMASCVVPVRRGEMPGADVVCGDATVSFGVDWGVVASRSRFGPHWMRPRWQAILYSALLLIKALSALVKCFVLHVE